MVILFSFRGKSAIVLLEQKRVVDIDLKVQNSKFIYKNFPALLVIISVC